MDRESYEESSNDDQLARTMSAVNEMSAVECIYEVRSSDLA